MKFSFFYGFIFVLVNGLKHETIKNEHQPRLPLLHNSTLLDKKDLGNGNNNRLSDCGWVLYKQCDSAWGNDELGTSSNTICSAGCAMSSVAMYLHHYGQNYDPGTLNQWLDGHGGYEDGDLLVWASVDVLGPSFQGIETGVSVSTLSNGIDECHGIIANVRSGTHWVLLTGYAGNNVFYVNDPGFSQDTYDYSDMSEWAVYH